MKYILIAILIFHLLPVRAEDGSRLWLRYEPVDEPVRSSLMEGVANIYLSGNHPSLQLASDELSRAMEGFTGKKLAVVKQVAKNSVMLVVAGSREARRAGIQQELEGMHRDGFLIRPMVYDRRPVTVIASPNPVGVLYGVFAFVRSIQTGTYLTDRIVKSEPDYDLRMLNHWDNLNGTIERGYAGYSLWRWEELPHTISPRYAEYARANASVGINGMVPNNVNANPLILSEEYIPKLKVLADIFRPYVIQLFV